MPQQDPQKVAEAQSAVAVESAATHAEEVEKARKAQLEAAISSSRQETLNIFTEAMRDVLTEGHEGTKALLIQKIPLLCTDMLTIKADIRWIKWLVMGVAGIIAASIIANLLMKLNGL